MRKVLVIAPHQDDEINLIGTIINQLVDFELHICFVTNGDSIQKLTKKRIEESLRVGKLLNAEMLYYLGFPDTLSGEHIYNFEENKIVTSDKGLFQTYGVYPTMDYRYIIDKVHSQYTLAALKNDLFMVLKNVHADLIFCVDYDSHPDHRMVSLVFDECIKRLVMEEKYNPIVLKKFAYIGTWNGQDDYFKQPLPCTTFMDFWNKENYLECLPYEWNDRISVMSDKDLLRNFFWNTSLYKLLKQYKTQNAKFHFFSIANADTVYWYKNTNNISLSAKVIVSSGNGLYINDNKICETNNVCKKQEEYSDYDKFSQCAWSPDPKDNRKRVDIYFDGKRKIKYIRIYQNFPDFGFISHIKIFIGDHIIDHKCSHTLNELISVSINEYTDSISIEIIKSTGFKPGFREIEIYDSEADFPWEQVPFSEYKKDDLIDERNPIWCKIGGFLLFIRKVKFKVKIFLAGKYKEIIHECDI